MASENDSAAEWHGQPFLRVDGDGVAQLDAAHKMTMGIAENDRGSVGSVEVQPEIFAAADLRDGRNIVNSTGVSSSGGGDNAEGLASSLAIFSNRLLQGVEIKLGAVSDRNTAKGASAEAEKAHGFVERMVGFC